MMTAQTRRSLPVGFDPSLDHFFHVKKIPREYTPDCHLFVTHAILDRDSFMGGLPRLLIAFEVEALTFGRFLKSLNHFINVVWLQFVSSPLCHGRCSK